MLSTLPAGPTRQPRSCYRLRFQGLALDVLLEGFEEHVARAMGRIWMAGVRAVSTDQPAAYRITMEAVPARGRRLPVHTPCSTDFVMRYQPGGAEDLIRVAGGEVRVAPGRPLARVVAPPHVLRQWPRISALLWGSLSHALALRGAAIAHAAAFEVFGRGILVLGQSGAGKSTLAAAAMAAGGRVVSDDSVLLSLDARGRPTVRPLRDGVWLRRGTPEVLPVDLRRTLGRRQLAGEARWCLARDRPNRERFLSAVAPRFVLHLRRDRRLRGFRLRPLCQSEAFALLVSSGSPLWLGSDRYPLERARLLPVLTAVAEGTRAFQVTLGRDLVRQPRSVLRSLVEALARGEDGAGARPGLREASTGNVLAATR